MGRRGLRRAREAVETHATERQLQALELRIAGLPTNEIAERLGVRRTTVLDLLNRAMAARKEDIAERADELRAVQLERIEAGIRGLWPSYSRGDYGAVDRMVKLLQRQAALLGLDLKPPDVTVDQSQNVIVLPAWGEQPTTVDSEARELGSGSGDAKHEERNA